jgi:hypothetical protein
MKQNKKLICYHRTSAENAHSIMKNGFMNSAEYFLTNRTWTGVWLSSRPPQTTDRFQGESLLVVHLDMTEQELARWEFTGEGRSHREWLIPAKIVNRRATVELVEQLEFSPVGVNPLEA